MRVSIFDRIHDFGFNSREELLAALDMCLDAVKDFYTLTGHEIVFVSRKEREEKSYMFTYRIIRSDIDSLNKTGFFLLEEDIDQLLKERLIENMKDSWGIL